MMREQRRLNSHELLPGLLGQSKRMREVSELVSRCAKWPVPVFVRGESGTGKELVARAIHTYSSLSAGPWVAVNGAMVRGEMGLSMLFGHVRGAFTGAHVSRRGAFCKADGGTLFIDEVGALPVEAQAALLRVLESQVVQPLGADEEQRVAFRIVTASCEPIEGMLAEGRFRSDLYQRLASCIIVLPPLRERLDDVGLLAEHLLQRSDMPRLRLGSGALPALRTHRFPGNVRELKNVLIQAALESDSNIIEGRHVLAALAGRRMRAPCTLDAGEVTALVAEAGGNVSEAARRAGVPRSTFRDLLRAAENRTKAPAVEALPAPSPARLDCVGE